jgi:hypothetical protein
MRLAWIFMVVSATSARADHGADWEDDSTIVPQPVLPTEPARREGPIARQWVDSAMTYAHLGAPTSEGAIDAFSLQLAVGPKPVKGTFGLVFGNAFGWLDDYALRLRWTYLATHEGSNRQGPLTIAVQRFFDAAPLAVAPLIHLHAGIESAIATPWLDDRRSAPPAAYQRMYAVDTELAHNGYSVRPLGVYVRADALFCHNLFLETGLSPELFVPTTDGGSREYDLRWHASFGFNFACPGDPLSPLRPLAISFEVRGRGRLYAADGPPDHHALDSVALQYHLGKRLVIDVFGSRATGVPLDRYFTMGVRIQVGLGGRK